MKCSIIISVLDSHEILRRQLLHFERIMPANFELIIMDDGSEVPLSNSRKLPFPLSIVPTHDTRPWTNNQARNFGAEQAKGEYLLMTDIDHVMTQPALQAVSTFQGDMLRFRRRIAQLDIHGRPCNLGAQRPPHVNTFAVKKDVFEKMGGYNREYAGYGTDWVIRQRYQNLETSGQVTPCEWGPAVFVITDQQWFHKLERIARS